MEHTVPELRIYRVWEKPVGPHITGMFEVNVFNPEQFGAFIPWLVVNRGPLSALVHPNTGDDVRDHTQRATWMGEPYPLNIGLLKKFTRKLE
jgi:aromatic ring-cleaving dioxygenase